MRHLGGRGAVAARSGLFWSAGCALGHAQSRPAGDVVRRGELQKLGLTEDAYRLGRRP